MSTFYIDSPTRSFPRETIIVERVQFGKLNP